MSPVKKVAKKVAAKKVVAAEPKQVKQRVNVSKMGEGASPLRDNPNAVRLAHGHEQLPFDLPVYVTVTRMLNEKDQAVEAHVISLDCFTFGRTIHIRIGKKKGWRKGHSPETEVKASNTIRIWVNKTKIYEGVRGDADDNYRRD